MNTNETNQIHSRPMTATNKNKKANKLTEPIFGLKSLNAKR